MSYVTLKEAEEYFGLRVYSEAWEKASEQTKNRVLQTATYRVDALPFKGKKLDPTQEMAFPRDFMQGVPTRLKYAVYEEALSLLEMESDPAKGVTSVQIGDASETYSEAVVTQRLKDGVCPTAKSIIAPYLVKAVGLK
ncbi:MAG: hypothetical protein PHN69_03840 [Candidatus Pacebacteria bacterium]|nr:hypothetical protein [Candidatus Paceibacterota bacterium]